MIVKTKGLIVRTVNYSETSLIATIYTRELGVKGYMMRGVRSNKGKKHGNLFQPLQFLDMVADQRENKNLQYVKEFKPDFVYKSIPFDVRKSAIGLFMLEVIIASVKEEEPNHQLYDFIENAFKQLDEQEEQFANYHLQFLLNLSVELGFQPMNNFSDSVNRFALLDGLFVSKNDHYPHSLSLVDSELFARFLNNQDLQLTKKERKQLLAILEEYYQFHMMDFKQFRTPFVFEEIFG